MSGFRAVNTTLSPPENSYGGKVEEATTPTTPRPPATATFDSHGPADDPKTPTRDSFGSIPGQRPLPTSSFPHSMPNHSTPDAGLKEQLSRENSQRSVRSADSEDVDMGNISDDGHDGSDNESATEENGRPSKKKKGQRFFCTQFPPCQLSFTRSEHLARHIRKHTGERPFQCHCNRRFSRLDNLRQHAQTVHVNEDIPTDSLAASGTRFQRQVRSERIRPNNGRSRASTVGSQTGQGRAHGHARNLSASSVSSTTSNFSAPGIDPRRRPPPLMMAGDPAQRNRLPLDTYRSPPDSPNSQYQAYQTSSPGGFSTPTSTTYSTGGDSPRFGPVIQSPASSIHRSGSLFGNRAPARRLSVPSGANPFQSSGGAAYLPSAFSPLQTPSSMATFSQNSSNINSPTSSTFSNYSRRDSTGAAEAEWRRRTWHPGTYYGTRPATSGLTYYQTPDEPRPSLAPQAAAGQATRLPGIESFDRMHERPATPPRRGPSPMQVDSPSRPPMFVGPVDTSTMDNRRSQPSNWDMSLHHNLTRLDIANTPPKEVSWFGQPPGPTRFTNSSTTGRPVTAPQPLIAPQSGPMDRQEFGKRPAEAFQRANSPPQTPRKAKRHGWYNGPLPGSQNVITQRTSPEDSSSSDGVPTPSTSSIGEYQPSIVHSNGFIESNHPVIAGEEIHQNYAAGNPPVDGYSYQANGAPRPADPSKPQVPARPEGDMGRLEALVAVATSEEKPR